MTKTKSMKRIFGVICAFSMLISMSANAVAAGSETATSLEAPKSIQISYDGNSLDSGASLSESLSAVPEESIQLNMKARGTWVLADEIFNGYGDLTAADSIDMYIVQTAKDTAPAMKIVSDNPNLIVRLYFLDMSTGNAEGTTIYDQAGDDTPNILGTMPAGDYVLGVYSLDQNQPAGDYTLMWNCANPGGAVSIVDFDSNLTSVILGYNNPPAIYCNGTDWLTDLSWEEHYTFSYGSGYSGRDQSISNITVRQVNVGTYQTNKYSTNNALFVEVGVGSLWTIMRSQYSNINGSVTHIMDYTDATGQETPRRFTDIDVMEPLGPHYIVIDLDTFNVVDFASPYNYLWLSGQTTGSATFTRTNILGQ